MGNARLVGETDGISTEMRDDGLLSRFPSSFVSEAPDNFLPRRPTTTLQGCTAMTVGLDFDCTVRSSSGFASIFARRSNVCSFAAINSSSFSSSSSGSRSRKCFPPFCLRFATGDDDAAFTARSVSGGALRPCLAEGSCCCRVSRAECGARPSGSCCGGDARVARSSFFAAIIAAPSRVRPTAVVMIAFLSRSPPT